MPRQPTRKPITVRKDPTLRKGKAKNSVRVTHRIKAAYNLLAVIKDVKDDVREGFRLNFEIELRDGEALPDQGVTLDLAGRWVKTASDTLEVADHHYCSQGTERKILNDGIVHIARREIYPKLRDTRREIDWRYGPELGSKLHRIEGRTRRKPKRQFPQLKKLVLRLRKPPPIEPMRPGPADDIERWLARMEPWYVLLEDKLEELREMEIREQQLRNDRDFELESFDVVFARAVGLVGSLLLASGFSDKALKGLLPAVMRRRRSAKARRERKARADGRRSDGRRKAEAPGTGEGGQVR